MPIAKGFSASRHVRDLVVRVVKDRRRTDGPGMVSLWVIARYLNKHWLTRAKLACADGVREQCSLDTVTGEVETEVTRNES